MLMSEALPALVGFALVATISPGGATTLATASGTRFGVRRSLPLIGGIAFGLAALGGASALGIASVMLAAPPLEFALRLAGSGYLLWLSWKIARSGAPSKGSQMEAPIGTLGGVALLWLNPKAWAMTISAASTFGEGGTNPLGLALILAPTFGLAAVLSLLVWSAIGVLLSLWLRAERHWRVVNGMLGFALVISILPMWV